WQRKERLLQNERARYRDNQIALSLRDLRQKFGRVGILNNAIVRPVRAAQLRHREIPAAASSERNGAEDPRGRHAAKKPGESQRSVELQQLFDELPPRAFSHDFAGGDANDLHLLRMMAQKLLKERQNIDGIVLRDEFNAQRLHLANRLPGSELTAAEDLQHTHQEGRIQR